MAPTLEEFYAMPRRQRLASHCKNGHEFTAENTAIYQQGTTWVRRCVACRTEYNRWLRRERAEVNRAYQLKYYEKTKQKRSQEKLEAKREAVEYMGGACERCGYNEHMAPLQFHHRPGVQKLFHVGSELRRRPWEELVSEMDKCELLCANCHQIEHCTWAPEEVLAA